MSAIIARIAPAATAVITAMSCGETPSSSRLPSAADRPLATAIAPHTPNTYLAPRPACFMPATLESPSGTFEMTTAASMVTPIPPPPSSETPSTTDSGTPSSSAPTAMAVPLPAWSCSVGWLLLRLRCRAPYRASRTLAST